MIKRLGLEDVVRLIREELKLLRPDPRWTSFLGAERVPEKPARAGSPLPGAPSPKLAAWMRSNVRPQPTEGYFTAAVTLPLGDLTSAQARRIATLSTEVASGHLRATVEQNLCFRWVSGADIEPLHAALEEIGLAEPGAGTITDMVACPGTDTCKLGISSSRGLAGELRKRLHVVQERHGIDPAVQGLHVKMSGCFNSCGQHHAADIGFLGVSRTIGSRRVPHFQLVVGGQWSHNAGAYGLAIGAIPSKRVPEMLERLTTRFAEEKKDSETFQAFIQRIGKKEVRAMVEALSDVPAYEVDRSFYSDWGDPREYSIGDMGVGECAGEVVPYVQMALASAEREVFEAQVLLDANDLAGASLRAKAAMLTAARSLVREVLPNIGEGEAEIVSEFRTHLVEPKVFFDRFAGAKFSHMFFRATSAPPADTHEAAHQSIEEAQLFIDAAHQCYEAMAAKRATVATE